MLITRRALPWLTGIYFEGEEGAGGGGNGTPPPKEGEEGSGTPPAEKKDGEGDGTPPTPKAENGKVTLTEAELQAERDRVAAATRRSIEEEASKKAAKEKGEFERLLGQEETAHAATKESLDRVTKERDQYAVRIRALIDDEIKTWPESLKKTAPDSDDLGARITWVEKSRDLAKEMLGTGAPEIEGGNRGQGGGSGDGKGIDKNKPLGSQVKSPNPYFHPAKKDS